MFYKSIQEFRGKKSLIVGEVNTGKTRCTAKILERFFDEGIRDLTIIDMAPRSVKGIGGKMGVHSRHSAKYFTAEIVAPRLVGKTIDETKMLAERNAGLVDEIFVDYLKKPGEVLFINDVSIYLQAGDLDKLLTYLQSTPTVVMNGYYGLSLGGGDLGKREGQQMKTLQERCDKVIHAPAPGLRL